MAKYEDPYQRKEYLYQKILGLVYELFNRPDMRDQQPIVSVNRLHEALQEDHPDLGVNESRELVRQLIDRGLLKIEYVEQGGNICFGMTSLGEDKIVEVIKQERNDLTEFAYSHNRNSTSPSRGFTEDEAKTELEGAIEIELLIAGEVASGNLEIVSNEQGQKTYRMTEAALKLKNSSMATTNVFASEVFASRTGVNDIGLDPELWERCSEILSNGTESSVRWNSAVRDAATILETRLKAAGNVKGPKPHGATLVSQLFKEGGVLGKKFDENADRQAYKDIFAGVMGTIRNPSSHGFPDPSPTDGRGIVLFINYLLGTIKELEKRSDVIEN